MAGTIALVVAFLAWAAWDLHRIRSDLEAGQQALDGLTLGAASSTGLTELAETAADHLASASSRAERSLPLRALGVVPGLGDQVHGIQRMTEVTAVLGASGRDAAQRIDHTLASAGEPAGRLRLLDTTLQEMDRIAADLERLDLRRPAGLVGPLRSAHDDLADAIGRAQARLAEGRALVEPVRDLLAGPSSYLLLAANNAEMAGGAGLALSAGVLTFDGGEIDLGEVVGADQLRLPDMVALPGDLHDIYRPTGVGIDFRSSTRSPNLPAMGPIIQAMAARHGLTDLEGVVVVDAVTLQRLMEVVGDVTVGGRTITADTVLADVLNENYRQFDSVDERADRVSYQGEIAEAVFEAMTERDVDAAALVSALLDSVRGRHLLLWSADGELEHTWDELGASGALPADGLLVSFQNYSANKMDWYLRPELALDVRLLPSGDYRARLTMTLPVPSRAEVPDASAYVLGPSPDLQGLFLTAHLPAAAYDITTPDPPGFRTTGLDGPMEVRTFLLDVPLGTTAVRHIDFSLPRSQSELTLLPSARLEGVPLTVDGVATVTDAEPTRLTWLVAHPPGGEDRAPTAVRWAVVTSTLALLVAAAALVPVARRPAAATPRAAAVAQLGAMASLATMAVAAVLALLLSNRPR